MLSGLLNASQPVGAILGLFALYLFLLGTNNLYVLGLAASAVFLLGIGLVFD